MTALILGATSRIAQEVARRYAESGHAVFVASRDTTQVAHIADDLRIRYDAVAGSGLFDARDTQSHPDFIAQVEDQFGPIEVAVLAFGDMGDQAESQQNFEAARRVIDINYTGAVSVCECIASRMEARRRGTIIGVASVAGDRGRQSNYIYGSAKGAFTLYLQGLRNRLYHSTVHVLTARLGFVDTRMTFGMKTGIPIADPAVVSRIIVNRADKGANDIYVPRFWWLIMFIIRSIPSFLFKRLKL